MRRAGRRPDTEGSNDRLPQAPRPRTPSFVIELCRIESFSFEEGLGTLRTGAGAAVTFDVGLFRAGGYRPTALEARSVGTSNSPVLPRVGEVVGVVWRTDVADVPETVSRISPPSPRFTLTEWLAGVNERTDLLDGITARAIRECETYEARRGAVFGAVDAAYLLGRVREIEETYDETPEPWVEALDASTPDDWDRIAGLLGLAEAPEAGTLDFNLYLGQVNALAEEDGIDLRLFEIEAGADEHVVLALEPDQYEVLEADGYVRSPRSREPMPRGASSIEEAREWLTASTRTRISGGKRFEHASAFDLVAASRRVFRQVCARRVFEAEVEEGPPDRFFVVSKDAEGKSRRTLVMCQQVEEKGGRAFHYRLVDRDGDAPASIDDLLAELDDRIRLEGRRFQKVEELEEHLLTEQDDWARTVAGLRMSHEDADDEGVWLSKTESAGEEWIELTLGVTDQPVSDEAVLEAASISSAVAQRQGSSLELRATLPLSVVTGARVLDLVDLLVSERTYLREELFGEDA